MEDKEALADRYRRMYQGMVGKDRALLDQVLAPDFVLTHMTGTRQSKEAFIRVVENGTLNYSSAEHEDITAQVRGDRASLTGKSLVHAAVFGGGWHTWRLRLDCRLRREGGRWQMYEAEASTY